ncbi:MAG: long-chain fatty acid--CoA ligase [Reyranella sp.]|nr:long-chain fatty acid--CoA ligase [Reyranella sp.]
MLGLMQDAPLLISGLLDYAERYHPRAEIVSRDADGGEHRYGYAEAAARARRLASALRMAGIQPGDRVATLAMNHHRHFELYFGVSGMGAVLHTVNPRLFAPQIDYIVNHGGSRVLFVDPAFVSLIASLASALRCVDRYVVLGGPEAVDEVARALPNVIDYESFLATGRDGEAWPSFNERTASTLCYTSGTTGNPKGVLYSHRSTVLHALSACQPGSFDISAHSVLLAIPPMFHANAWSFPYLAAMTGAKLVLPGPRLDGESLQGLIEAESATFTVGVPTVFTMLLDHLRRTGKGIAPLSRAGIGGSAVPRAMIDELAGHGCTVLQLWGMTETSPLGTIATSTPAVMALDETERADVLAQQGRVRWGLEARIVREDGSEAPRDGKTAGSLWVRGPWVAKGYFGADTDVLDDDGWFPTGDVATLDASGYLRITDRTKDVIKSGGEWISSLEIENLACSVPGVRQAAVIAAYHPKWEERPLLVIVPDEDRPATREEVLDHLRPRIAKWWLPDDVVSVDALPMTATGKVSKLTLRERFRDHLVRRA